MKAAENKPDKETLQRLYEEDRLTQRQIGKIYRVRHITIKRWMQSYGISSRPTGRGLENRGITAPTADELFQMVHVDHLSYRDIAARYGVDPSAIPHWLKSQGISLPSVWKTRRKGHEPTLPSATELAHRRSLGESITSIAKSCGVTRNTIGDLCRRHGIPVDRDGWDGGRRLPCLDGHEARSTYEQRVDDWLSQHGIAHQLEPRYPFDSRYRADFLVEDTYIEVWGVANDPSYKARKANKIALCEANEVPLIGINWWQFSKGRRWWRPLQKLLVQSPAPCLFYTAPAC